jgi:hypothetical protein
VTYEERQHLSRISDCCLLSVAVQRGLAMTAQYARHTVVRNPENLEDSFRIIYSGFVNGIRIPTDGVQDARWTRTIETNGINGATNLTNEEGWIEVKKVTFKEQDQFGKTKRFGRIDK